MLRSIGLATLVATLILNFWGFAFWALSPWPMQVIKSIPLESLISPALNASLPDNGIYFMPAMPKDMAMEDPDFIARAKAGPTAFIAFEKDGFDPASPRMILLGLGHFFIAALLMSGLCYRFGGPSFKQRYGLVFGASLLATWINASANPIWWHFPLDWLWLNGAYGLGGWLLASAVIAKWAAKPANE